MSVQQGLELHHVDVYVGVYVDDMALAGRNDDDIKHVKEGMSSKFDIQDMGELNYFLGMTVIQDKLRGQAWMGQWKSC